MAHVRRRGITKRLDSYDRTGVLCNRQQLRISPDVHAAPTSLGTEVSVNPDFQTLRNGNLPFILLDIKAAAPTT